ncbi:MAG: FAD-dependent oxidoreductase [Methylacidiphilales bacterium]|nr:FAD-dependent oxidoreductase [Candidatus Methylacidiphilales bacterium]MDW8349859.1 FAD-dependent oxidoreductase [Verrucomicrobiae bacterium]
MDLDVIIIGGGSAGYAAARTAVSEFTKRGVNPKGRVALIEGASQLGGLCILRGCMPTKALLESSHRYRAIREAEKFGLLNPSASPNADRIWKRKDDLIRGFAEHRIHQLTQGVFTFIRGKASFINSHQLQVESTDGISRLQAKAFVIATGSEIHWPSIPGLREADPLTSDAALERSHIPQSLIVLGGGAVALEFAQFYHELGTEVTLLQRSDQIARDFDVDIAAELEAALQADGIKVCKGVELISIENTPNGKRVTFEHQNARRELIAEEIFHGLGRQPAISGLNLEAASIEMKGGRVLVNAHQQTNQSHIFAAGDVTGEERVVHVAVRAGEIAGSNAVAVALGESERASMPWKSLSMAVIFTSPELARVGFRERDLIQNRVPYLKATYPFNDHGKSIIHGAEYGIVKILAEKGTGRILGASAVGPMASDLIHEIVPCIYFGATAKDLAAMPHYHPTLAEIWTYPAEEIAAQCP